MGKQHILAIIPARGGSVGIPNKNIVPLLDRPLLSWTISQALNSDVIDDVIVSTDSDEIASLARSNGALVVKRPSAISGNDASSEDAVIHALQVFIKENQIDINDVTVIFLQATSPLRKANDIANAYILYNDLGCESLFSSSIAADLTLWNCINEDWKSTNFDYRCRKTRQAAPIQYVENGSIYIFEAAKVIATKNRLHGKIGNYVMEPWQVHEIDEPDDLELVSYYMEKNIIIKKGEL